VVDVVNHLHGSSTSIHWHGILQRDAQYMDGVPMLTQCPIVEGTTFRYAFPTDESGTFFWHSHDGIFSNLNLICFHTDIKNRFSKNGWNYWCVDRA
jgi:FtsP/CotA-like multicopper oxidase with cupredoxin domain